MIKYNNTGYFKSQRLYREAGRGSAIAASHAFFQEGLAEKPGKGIILKTVVEHLDCDESPDVIWFLCF